MFIILRGNDKEIWIMLLHHEKTTYRWLLLFGLRFSVDLRRYECVECMQRVHIRTVNSYYLHFNSLPQTHIFLPISISDDNTTRERRKISSVDHGDKTIEQSILIYLLCVYAWRKVHLAKEFRIITQRNVRVIVINRKNNISAFTIYCREQRNNLVGLRKKHRSKVKQSVAIC